MKFVIPAKTNSTRIPNKNWREFAGGKSLVEITVDRLMEAGAKHGDIYVSTERELPEQQRLRGQVNFLDRSEEATKNDYPLTEWIRGICEQVPGDDEIAWCQVCDPMFSQHEEAIARWETCRDNYDSLCVVYRAPGYLLDEHMRPVRWSPGEHHTVGQTLPSWHQMPWTFSILKRDTIARFGYHFGRNPLWLVSSRRGIDIDTMGDFELAGRLYSLESS